MQELLAIQNSQNSDTLAISKEVVTFCDIFVSRLVFVESSVDSEDHFPCLFHLTSVVTKVLLTGTLEGEYIGFTGSLDLTSGALLGPVEGELILSIFECFKLSK